MLQIIAFSYNRALQLDTLLSSLISNWVSPDYHVDVVYNYSSKDFGEGYERLIKEYSGKPITLHRENTLLPDRVKVSDLLCLDNIVRLWRQPRLRKPKTDFRSIVLRLLTETSANNVMFLTDDSMFVSKVCIPQHIFDWVNSNPKQNQFSLRLGKGKSQLPKAVNIEGDFCAWNMYQNKDSWGYPFSVDAHIYNKQFILYLFSRYLFTNPNTLEMNVVGSVIRSKWLSNGRCFIDIKMLTFPINIVQNSVDNVSQDVSVEMLNKRYLSGDRLLYIPDKAYDPTKQYVKCIKFIDSTGKEDIVEICDDLVHHNDRP